MEIVVKTKILGVVLILYSFLVKFTCDKKCVDSFTSFYNNVCISAILRAFLKKLFITPSMFNIKEI